MTTDIVIEDKRFTPFISHEEIQKKIKEKAQEVSRYCKEKGVQPTIIVVLKGAFIYASDFVKALDKDLGCFVEFVKLSSYSGTESSGKIIAELSLHNNIQNHTLIVLEDIVDTGSTMKWFLNDLKKNNPTEVKLISLLYKPSALKHSIGPIDYCFEIENKFVVGYGLDYNGLGRNLPDIYRLVQ